MTPSDGSPTRLFAAVFWLTLLLKVVLSAAIPLTGDEAYFVLWGRYLDYGYYDHPPMCGWVMHAMLYLGSAPVVLRLPAVVFSQLVGLGIYIVLRRSAPDKAVHAATLYLLTPLNLLNVLVTTDTPFFLFAFCCVATYAAAIRTGRRTLFLAAGAFLGMAFLSKYFAVLIAAALAVHWCLLDRSRRAFAGLALTALAAVPFALIHIAWNYNNSWVTFTFNALSRGEGFDPLSLPLLLCSVLYLATPAVAWYLARYFREWRRVSTDASMKVFASAILVPLVCFAAISVTKEVGLHWLIAFVPFLFVLLPLWFTPDDFVRVTRLTAVFSFLHMLIIVAALLAPIETWRDLPAYQSIAEGARPENVREALAPYLERFVPATRSYSRSAVLSYNLGTNVLVFGGGSKHGRHFDLITDFRSFKDRDMMILETNERAARAAVPYFKRARVVKLVISGTPYHLVLGHEFQYGRYRNRILKKVVERYYTPPAWLPAGGCPLRERYFPQK